MNARAQTRLHFREGRAGDFAGIYELSERALSEMARRQGVLPADAEFGDVDVQAGWARDQPLLEFMAAQPHGSWWVCEIHGELAGHALVTRFGAMDELTYLMVSPEHQGTGVGRQLLEHCWPARPSPRLGRVAVAAGATADLSLYTAFGLMPVTGHWHMRQLLPAYVERRSLEIDRAEPAVHVLKAERAVEEWKRLEPPAIGHERPSLHEFFGRTRTCLAHLEEASGRAVALCWISSDGEIGPAVGASAESLIPVVLAALDRVAKMREPEWLGVYCTTDSWWLLDRLRRLGFRVYWPSWVMSSMPLPGLDRYVPSRPARLL
jgi:GNAT superfamily N-acetyltransferase